MRPSSQRAGKRGFTLIELLIVIGIIMVMTALSGPALSSLKASGSVNQNLAELSGVLELAREYAVAKNTYVWVAFYSSPVSSSPDSLSVAVFSSNDGTDPADAMNASWDTFSYGAVPSASISLINRILTLPQVALVNAASFSPNSLPSTPTVSSQLNSAATGSFFTLALPGNRTPVIFTRAVEFTPSGQARNTSGPIDVIDLDVQPQKGDVGDTKNVAVVRLNGLTGQTIVYRE